jgi:ubiquinone biosynthesis protein
MLAHEIGLEAMLASAVPEAYATYRRPLAAALAFFIDHLSPSRAATIMSEQLALPPEADDTDRLFALARRSPTLHKLGQILARDRRLEPQLRRTLQRLESMPSGLTDSALRPLIEQELGDLDRCRIALEPTALAEASVAVVVGFAWQGKKGVFKLLKPGVEQELAEELEILDLLGAFLDDQCASLALPSLDYRDTFARVRELVSKEVRLDVEHEHLAEAAQVFETMSGVRVPRLLPFRSPRLLAMEWIDGRKVTEVGDLAPLARQRLAGTVVEALVATPAWSAAPRALFHADPHAGNLMIDTESRLVPLDWSLGAHLEVLERRAIAQILLGAITRDAGAIVASLELLALRPPDRPTLRAAVERHLSALAPLVLPGLSWLMGLLDVAVTSAGLRVAAHLLAFRKALLTLDGVLADITPDLRLDDALLASFLPRLAAEWPFRAFLPLESRALPTRISTGDLTRLAAALPWLTVLALLDRAGWAEHVKSGQRVGAR